MTLTLCDRCGSEIRKGSSYAYGESVINIQILDPKDQAWKDKRMELCQTCTEKLLGFLYAENGDEKEYEQIDTTEPEAVIIREQIHEILNRILGKPLR